MQKSGSALWLSLLMLIIIQPLHSQWVQTNGPYGASVYHLVANESDLFAATAVGVYHSTDQGTFWTASNHGLTNLGVGSLMLQGSNLFAGISPHGVYLSTDLGQSWTLRNNGLPDTISVNCLVATGTSVLAGTEHGIYRSTDGGASWTEASTGLLEWSRSAMAFAVQGSRIYASIFGERIYTSTDDGRTWNSSSTGLPTTAVVTSFAVHGADVFAGISERGVYLSTDEGVNWSAVNTGLTNRGVESLAISDTELFAGTTAGLYRSTNRGNSWAKLSGGIPADLPINSLLAEGQRLYAGIGAAGVYVSFDNGTTWFQRTDGMINSSVRSFCTNSGYLFAGMAGNGVCRSGNGGADWTPSSSGLPLSGTVFSLAGSGTILCAGTNSNGIYRSTNAGLTWANANTGLVSYCSVYALAVQGTRFYAGTDGSGVYVSTDGGMNWAASGGMSDPWVHSLAISEDRIFAGCNGGVYVSTDSGSTWLRTNLDPTNAVTSLLVSGENLFAGTGDGVYRTCDNGTNWTWINTGLPRNQQVYSLISGGNGLFASTILGIYLTTDSGASWSKVDTGLADKRVFSLIAIGSELFAGTYGAGVSRRPLSEMVQPSAPELIFPMNGEVFFGGFFTYTWRPFDGATAYHLQSSKDPLFQTDVFLNDSTLADTTRRSTPTDTTYHGPFEGSFYWRIRARTSAGWSAWSIPWMYILSPCDVQEKEGVAKEFVLDQNYPNPFNPSTTISYTLPRRSYVTLSVYNTLGQQVRSLVDGEVEAGYHQVQFNAAGLASGVYFYRLHAPGFVQTRKLLLVQ